MTRIDPAAANPETEISQGQETPTQESPVEIEQPEAEQKRLSYSADTKRSRAKPAQPQPASGAPLAADEAKRILEALLFVFSQPLPLKRILGSLPEFQDVPVRQIIAELNAEYTAAQRAFSIQEVAGGYQLMTAQDLAPWIQRALQAPKHDSVSAAALETLAIIAYRQPITKAEVELIRGVDAGGALETLMERKFVRIAGRKETPGRPFLYGTTTEFLRHFGLRSLEALPKPQEPVATGVGPGANPALNQLPTLAEPAGQATAAEPSDESPASGVLSPADEPEASSSEEPGAAAAS